MLPPPRLSSSAQGLRVVVEGEPFLLPICPDSGGVTSPRKSSRTTRVRLWIPAALLWEVGGWGT